jgi:hypothetical protein
MTTSSPPTDLSGSAHDQASASFEQAKKPARGPQFLQIVAKPKRAAARGKSQAKPEPKLTRVAFKVSRLMEFCSERELQNQTGHSVSDWALVAAKEGFDNALDACEEAEVAPEIAAIVEPDTIIVQDNANGIDAETIESILDYTIRVSSREAYVSPTRGAQGNALKTLLAMGYVLDRRRDGGGDAAGVTVIESRGVTHRIEFKVDHVNNQPRIVHTKAASPVKVGTKITIHWPPSKLLEWTATRFQELVRALSRRPCGERPRPRATAHGARIRRRVPRALRYRRSAQNPERGRLLASIARELLRRRSRQSRRGRQAPGGDEEI